MMTLHNEYIICFKKVVDAIMAEQALLEGSFPVRIMPVPPLIKEGCGFCLRLSEEDLEPAKEFLAERKIKLNDAIISEWKY